MKDPRTDRLRSSRAWKTGDQWVLAAIVFLFFVGASWQVLPPLLDTVLAGQDLNYGQIGMGILFVVFPFAILGSAFWLHVLDSGLETIYLSEYKCESCGHHWRDEESRKKIITILKAQNMLRK